MVWVRIDDHFDEHPKIVGLDDHAFALFVSGLAYCNRNLTDGFIPTGVGLGKLRYCGGKQKSAASGLVTAGLWAVVDGGWQVHDFGEYQPTKQQVEDERAKKQAAGQAGGQASAQARAAASAQPNGVAGAQAKSKPVPGPVNPVPLTQNPVAAGAVPGPGGVGGLSTADLALDAELRERERRGQQQPRQLKDILKTTTTKNGALEP